MSGRAYDAWTEDDYQRLLDEKAHLLVDLYPWLTVEKAKALLEERVREDAS